jgi:hypothetical protein
VLSSYLTYAWLYDAKTPVPAVDFRLHKPDARKAIAKATDSKPDKKGKLADNGKKPVVKAKTSRPTGKN